jgi:hypothetical protein
MCGVEMNSQTRNWSDSNGFRNKEEIKRNKEFVEKDTDKKNKIK